MRKRRKEFPQGTFIPFPQRLVAIIQLCITFSMVIWYATQPFMGEYFSLKSHMLLHEYVMGTSSHLKSEVQQDKLSRNQVRFTQLPESERQDVISDYQILADYAARPVHTKIANGLRALFGSVPPFELAWIFFATLNAILILLKFEGARRAAWLLPLIVIAYGIDSRVNGYVPKPASDLILFPNEATLLKDYNQETLSPLLNVQREQIQRGWEHYLAKNWSVSDSSQQWEQRIEEGEFYFTLARLQKNHLKTPTNWTLLFQERSSYLAIAIYFLWNLFFAWIINRKITDIS